MQERMTLEEYRVLVGRDKPVRKADRKTKRDNDLAMLTLISELERIGYKFGGKWNKEMTVDDDTIYLEYPFSKERKFRADLSIPTESLILEVHGGAFVVRRSKDGTVQNMGGAHHSIQGRRRDMEKARLANIEGWCYLEVEWKDVKDGTALNEMLKYLGVAQSG